MSNYVKATNFFTKDALLTGNPSKIIKGAEIDDEYNAIATAITSKADTTSPTFTGTPIAPTAGAGTNTPQIATTAFVVAALALMYPVGTIFTSTSLTNPATSLGFGTWVAFGAGRVLVGVGGAFTAGATGGSADAVVVSHNHSVSSSSSSSVSDPGHRHVFGADDQIASQGGYNTVGGFPYDAKSGGGGGGVHLLTKNTSLANAGETTGISVSTSTSTSITAAGVSGTNANLQPYVVVYMWQRTA
jgi:hypothetical protein